MPLPPTFILASASPRRYQLLQLLGWEIEVQPVNANEERLMQEDAVTMVTRLAALKAFMLHSQLVHVRSGLKQQRQLIVGADTTVEVEGALLGKPADLDEALSFLGMLKARDHFVHTGICVLDATTGQARVRSHSSRVSLRSYQEAEMKAYVDSGACMDKAGGYALQDRNFDPVVALDGCAASVMGLPLALLVEVCQDEFACPTLQGFCPSHCSQLTGRTCCWQAA